MSKFHTAEMDQPDYRRGRAIVKGVVIFVVVLEILEVIGALAGASGVFPALFRFALLGGLCWGTLNGSNGARWVLAVLLFLGVVFCTIAVFSIPKEFLAFAIVGGVAVAGLAASAALLVIPGSVNTYIRVRGAARRQELRKSEAKAPVGRAAEGR